MLRGTFPSEPTLSLAMRCKVVLALTVGDDEETVAESNAKVSVGQRVSATRFDEDTVSSKEPGFPTKKGCGDARFETAGWN